MAFVFGTLQSWAIIVSIIFIVVVAFVGPRRLGEWVDGVPTTESLEQTSRFAVGDLVIATSTDTTLRQHHGVEIGSYGVLVSDIKPGSSVTQNSTLVTLAMVLWDDDDSRTPIQCGSDEFELVMPASALEKSVSVDPFDHQEMGL